MSPADIETLDGTPASVLGLAAYANQDPACQARAFEAGINYFFFYSPGQGGFAESLAPLASRHRESMIIASGSGARSASGLRAARRKILATVKTERLDVFFTEYVHPDDDPDQIFGEGGVLDELVAWKTDGSIRYVGATAHDRPLARRLAEDERVDVLMHRFNMAHRTAATEVFPAAERSRTPVVAFTATRWGSLLEGHPRWKQSPATAADCYRYCLAQPAVRLVLTAPQTVTELTENLDVLGSSTLSKQQRSHWERYGDLVYGRGDDAFETEWP